MKTTAEKLRIAPGSTLWSSHDDRVEVLGRLPEGVELVDRPVTPRPPSCSPTTPAARARSPRPTPLPSRPRTRSGSPSPKGNRSDINRDTPWPILAEHGLRPIGQVGLDDVWSALRFRPLAPGEVFTGGGGKA